MIGGLLGGLFGGVLRLAPEVLKFFDRKNERAHELALGAQQMEQIRTQGTLKLEETRVGAKVAEYAALGEAFKEQSAAAAAAGPVVAMLSALVRPVLTWWFTALYTVVKVAQIKAAYAMTGTVYAAVSGVWGPEDMGLFTGIVTFWFVDRQLGKGATGK